MYSADYKLLSLTLLSAWPIWTGFLAAVLALMWAQGGRLLGRLPLAIGLPLVALVLYALVGRPGFEGWAFDQRADLKQETPLESVLQQHRVRNLNDPRDYVPAAVLGDYLMLSWDGSAEQLLAAHASYLDAERKGRLSADQYARWAQLVRTAADVVQLPSPRSYAALIDKALSIEPNNVSARFLIAIDQPAARALTLLRQLDREISPTDPLSDAIDEQILWLVVGEQPLIAPNVTLETVSQMAEASSDSVDGPAPFIQMVRRLESRVLDDSGSFPDFEEVADRQATALEAYRLARARSVLGDAVGAVSALEFSAVLVEDQDPLRFWVAMEAWKAGNLDWSLVQLGAFRLSLTEGSPEWRAVGALLDGLSASL